MISYYDLRASALAVNFLNGRTVNGRQLCVAFHEPKEGTKDAIEGNIGDPKSAYDGLWRRSSSHFQHMSLVCYQCLIHSIYAGVVSLFNVDDSIPIEDVLAIVSTFGDVKSSDVKSIVKHPSVRKCRLVEFYDVRHAELAYQKINANPSRVPTISEVSGALFRPNLCFSILGSIFYACVMGFQFLC